MRQALARLEYPVEMGTIWMLNNQNEYIGSLDESSLGRPTLNCRTILCTRDDYPVAALCSLDPGGPGDTAAVAKSVAAASETTGGASGVAVASSAAAAEAAAVDPGPPEEALPVIHIDPLYWRSGHSATSSLQQLVKGGLVRGLEGGIV